MGEGLSETGVYSKLELKEMQRRNLIIASGGLIGSATAGCLGSNNERNDSSPGSGDDDIKVEIQISIENGDLVAKHVSGDVLEAGRTVYVTAEGEKIVETTLEEAVHTGGEILRIQDFRDEHSGEIRAGLYLAGNSDQQELGVSTIEAGSLGPPVPNAQILFDYEADADQLELLHDGGDSITGDNTGVLHITAEGNTDPTAGAWGADLDVTAGADASEAAPASPVTSGDSIWTSAADVASGDVVTLQWQSNDGNTSTTVGTFEAP